MANITTAYTHLTNGSLFKAVNEAYTSPPIGIFFWPIIFLFTLTIIAIKTENPAYVTIYAVLGNFALATLLPITTHIIFYTTLVLSFFLVLWSFFGSSKVDSG